MTLVLTDTFDRADSATLGLSWVEGGCGFGTSLEIVSNAVKSSVASAEQSAYWGAVNGSDICTAFTLETLSTEDFDPFPFFVTTANTALGWQFYMRVPRTSIEVWRVTGGVFDTTISLSQTFVQGDAICARVVDNGSTVTGYVYRQAAAVGAWVEVGSAVFSGRDPGPFYPGIGIYNNTTTALNDFYTGSGSPVVVGTQILMPQAMRVR